MQNVGFFMTRLIFISALYWFGYEQMKSTVLQQRGSTKLTFTESFLSGALAGSVSQLQQIISVFHDNSASVTIRTKVMDTTLQLLAATA